MKRSTQIRGATACLLACLALAGCADRWVGSVDAVFRYRTEDSSTAVHEIRAGSLSERAGLQPGDRLIAIDGEDISGAPFGEVRAALRGPVGTMARLTVERDGRVVSVEVERLPVDDD